MDPKIVKKTQDTLGKIIKKPPLTEKLLNKPPFRFLHDIVTEVIRTTGFCKGLFTSTEMDSKNVTAKEDKLGFLQKLIDCVSFASGATLSARPSKIIAGHEPEKTNELLQAIAKCIKKGVSSADAVEKVNKGKSTKASKTKEKPEAKQESASKEERNKPEKRSKHDRDGDSERKREASADKRHRSRKEAEAEQPPDGGEKHEDREERKKHRSRKHREQRPEENTSSPNIQSEEADVDENSRPEQREAIEGAEQSAPTRAIRPASAKGQRRRPAVGRSAVPDGQADSPEEPPAAPRKLVRPPSARPAAPRVRQRRDPAEEEIARIDSGGQQRTAPIIVDNGLIHTDSEDEDEQFVVEEDNNNLQFEEQIETRAMAEDADGDEEHGGLVRKILETKKELEHSAGGKHAAKRHTEIQRSNVATAQQQKERQLVVKEIDRLRDSVQKLCQSATPLAKIIDYIQEDMDSMQAELQAWQKENKEHALRLKEEESITMREMEPLKSELEAAEQEIMSFRNQAAATKANIIRNQEKMNKMIMAVATRS